MNRKVLPLAPDCIPPLLCPDLQPVREVHRNPWFKIMDRGSYFVLEYDRPQTVILPVVDNSHVLMVRVWRPVISDTPLELPAGDSLDGETPQRAAQREMYEETGILVKDLNRFQPVLPVSEQPGRWPVLLSVFQLGLSMDEYRVRDRFDQEIIALQLIPFPEAKQMIACGEIYLSVPMAIIARFLFEKEISENIEESAL